MDKDKKLQDGFDLELWATQPEGHVGLSRGDNCSTRTFEHLRRIAEQILPERNYAVAREIQPYDHALHASARSHMQFEVVLTTSVRGNRRVEQWTCPLN